MYATEMASVGLAEEAFKQYLGLLSEIWEDALLVILMGLGIYRWNDSPGLVNIIKKY
jgi:hypothetical protein